MIVILRGDIITQTGKSHHDQIRDDVGSLEVASKYQGRKDGFYEFSFETATVVATGLEVQRVAGETRLGDLDVWISPLLGDLTLADLPDSFAFGNGSTGPIDLMIRGETRWITWCVFPYGTVLSDAQKYRLQEIFEGIPPGTPS